MRYINLHLTFDVVGVISNSVTDNCCLITAVNNLLISLVHTNDF